MLTNVENFPIQLLCKTLVADFVDIPPQETCMPILTDSFDAGLIAALCRNVDETKLLLKYQPPIKEGPSYPPQHPRILYAIMDDQKAFVAQENAQDVSI